MENNRSTEIKEFEIELDNLMVNSDNIKELGEYIHKLSGILLSKTILMNELYNYSGDNKNYQKLLSETKRISKLIIRAQDRVAQLDAHYSNNKYEITDIVGYRFKKKVYRIRALKDFGDVKKGDLGGFVSSYENLSQYGDCWIYNDAAVIDNALLENDSTVHNMTIVYDNSIIRGKSKVYNSTRICGSSYINNSNIFGKSFLRNVFIQGSGIKGNLITGENKSSIICSYIRGSLYLTGSLISGTSIISDMGDIYQGSSVIKSNLRLCKNSHINNSYIENCDIMRGKIMIKNTTITDSKINGKIDNVVKIVNKRILHGYIKDTNDVISLLLDVSDVITDSTDMLCYYRNENDKLYISFYFSYFNSIEAVIEFIKDQQRVGFTEDYIELLRQFDKIAQKHFNTN